MSTDFFKNKAEIYDKDTKRVSNVENIANAVIKGIHLHPKMHLMDFGSGTGLLLERIAPFVRKITAIDISKSMTEQLAIKQDRLSCEIDIRNIDLVATEVTDKFDGIISSMTMHHVKEIKAMFAKFHSLLHDDGFIAIADLDKEDGSFHTEDSGVHHSGFERDVIADAAKHAGFRSIKITNASIVHKPHGSYPVFLLTATKS
jgi:cyclopropane fatty-acyl-phospholipid synthase-like methyltransferase